MTDPLQTAAANYRAAVERYHAARASVALTIYSSVSSETRDNTYLAVEDARTALYEARDVLADAALQAVAPASMPPCDLDDRASIVAFLGGEADRFEDAIERMARTGGGSVPAAARMQVQASLLRTLAAQVARGDDRLGQEPTPSEVCGGVLHYATTPAGAFRVHTNGVYRARCATCKEERSNDGTPRTCDLKPTPAAR